MGSTNWASGATAAAVAERMDNNASRPRASMNLHRFDNIEDIIIIFGSLQVRRD